MGKRVNEIRRKRDNGKGFKDPRSQVSGRRFQVTGHTLRVTSLRLQATGYTPH